jgi:hypothetical protein
MKLNGNNQYKRKPKIEQVQFTARIHKDLFTQMEKLCEQKNVSLNFMLNRVIRSGMARIV